MTGAASEVTTLQRDINVNIIVIAIIMRCQRAVSASWSPVRDALT